jgi:multidrug efflux pump subunit AcrA (membrane-fusion protein)
MLRLSTIALLTCAAALLAAAPAHAHEGHDHGEAPVAASGPATPRLEAAGSELELVAVAQGHTLTIYLDRLATNEPVAGATIEVSGEGIAAQNAKEAGGTYVIEAPWLDEPGTRPLVFTVTAGGTSDLLAGTLVIPAQAVDAHAPPAWSELLSSPLLWIVAGIAALLGFVASFAFRVKPLDRADAEPQASEPTPTAASHLDKIASALILGAALAAAPIFADARAHEGHDEVPAAPVTTNSPRRLSDGQIFVPKPSQRLLGVRTVVAERQKAYRTQELIGTVVPDPSAFGQVQAPMDGRIELAEHGIPQIGQRVEAGETLALLSPTIPVADLGTMQQLTAEVIGKLRIAEQKLARLTRIAGVVAQKDIDDTRAELEALREQQRVLAPKDVERVPLKAPVSGVISVSNVRAGQVVTTRDTLFEIVDPNRLWIEALGVTAHPVSDISAAHAFDADGHSIKLSYVGRSPSLRQQSVLFQFKIVEQHEGLSVGSALKVFVQHGKPVENAVLLPDAAVVTGSNGLPQVWSKISPERFEPLPVRTMPIDGTHVAVLAGIEPGQRIVVEGAELINQVR